MNKTIIALIFLLALCMYWSLQYSIEKIEHHECLIWAAWSTEARLDNRTISFNEWTKGQCKDFNINLK